MILGERSKVRIRGIKGKFEETERDFGIFGDPGKEKENQRERKTREKGERGKILAKKPTSFEEKERRSCIPKSSYTQIISEGEVRSLTSVYNK